MLPDQNTCASNSKLANTAVPVDSPTSVRHAPLCRGEKQSWLTAPVLCCAVFLMSMVQGSTGFIIVRCCIGFSLACFVCCQFW